MCLGGCVLMTLDDGDHSKELLELNLRVCDEVKRAGDGGVMGEGQGDTGIDKIGEDGGGRAMQGQSVLQVSQPQRQPQGPVIGWERFLHVRSIKVLLVETDDSTRHVVIALLHNCNYEVMEATNGLHAWKILEDLNNHIDLVLTEVVMPSLSGIGLLCKIMSHKTRKNIPVIMISSHDSMSLVLKCLSKGAVDFLVKPIRKNELKNLWQHVWRRCHSSSGSGSGSESGTQTQKTVKSESSKRSDNSSRSDDRDDNGSIGLDSGVGSDNGSGTQSSWKKQAAEVVSSQAISPWDQIPDSPGSNCAQVIHSNVETSSNKWLCMTSTREWQEQLGNAELMIDKPKKLDLLPEDPLEVPFKLIGTKQNTLPELGKRTDKGQLNPSGESPSNKYGAVFTNPSGPQMDKRESEPPRELAKILETNHEAVTDSKELPAIEPCLKRLRVTDNGTIMQDDCNVLRHSELSAFSRYNTALNACKAPNRITRSRSPLADDRSLANGDPLHQSSHVGSNKMVMGSATSKTFIKPVVLKDQSETTSTVNALLAPSSVSHSELQVQHIHQHHHHHHHHHFLHTERKQLLSNHGDLSIKFLAVDAPYCGSSNVLGGPVEGNTANCSMNRSASGSNHGSNGQNGSSSAVNAGGTNRESDNGLAGKSRSGDASGSRKREDENKYAHREVALTKFREKRKERCFCKKALTTSFGD
ncbi:two-component response regulator-like APRR7 isoform X2 [Cornus florida]|uniref:two-component response regulator-like APRR7 isoform X2 n=1 Tax=Cornus florida TaxID=4283 RepID=UPI00289D6C86|nr:two-component response regulator-like APRR7 isoform X2 [Cornus florida]